MDHTIVILCFPNYVYGYFKEPILYALESVRYSASGKHILKKRCNIDPVSWIEIAIFLHRKFSGV